MSETKKWKVLSADFKARVGLEVVRGIKTINEIAQDYEVHPMQIGQWKRAIQEQAKTLFEGRRGPTPVASHQEPECLYSEIGRLKMELDWLKKNSERIRDFLKKIGSNFRIAERTLSFPLKNA